jgi:hypothetical protein
MNKLNRVFNFLKNKDVIFSTGFMVGFAYNFKFNKNTLLTTIFNSLVCGCVLLLVTRTIVLIIKHTQLYI